jgi:hypothetical protein
MLTSLALKEATRYVHYQCVKLNTDSKNLKLESMNEDATLLEALGDCEHKLAVDGRHANSADNSHSRIAS